MIDCCQNIAMRFVNHRGRQAEMLALAQLIKFNTRWRQVTYSETAASGLWDHIRGLLGEDTIDLIISMTGEMTFRLADDIEPANAQSQANDSFYPLLAKSLAWMKTADAVNKEQKQFTAEATTYRGVFEKNPWVLFLYLLSMSDIVRILTDLELPPLPVSEGGDNK